MKKTLSLILAFVFVAGIFISAPITANAADYNYVNYEIKSDGFKDGKITFDIYLSPNQRLTDALLTVRFNKDVLNVLDAGPATAYDEDGYEYEVVPGTYEYGTPGSCDDDAYTFAYIRSGGYNVGSKAKRFVTITFKLIDQSSKYTSLKFYKGAYDECITENLIESFSNIITIDTPNILDENIVTGNGKITFSWDSIKGSNGGYSVYKKENGKYVTLADGITSTSYTHKGDFVSGETYSYAVASREGTYGFTSVKYDFDVVYKEHEEPENKIPVVSLSIQDNGILLNWDSVSNAESYRIYRRKYYQQNDYYSSWQVISQSTFATSYLDKNVALEEIYSYAVRAITGNTLSDYTPTEPIMYLPNNKIDISNLTFTFDGLNYVVTDCNTSAVGELVIPSKYNGYSVTEIGVSAFSGCSYITSVMLPDTIEKIGANAFYDCRNLRSIDLGEGVNYIGNRAFAKCRSLAELNIPASVTEIDLTGYLYSYDDYTDAFENCRSLVAFNVSTNNPNYASIDGVLFDKSKTTLLKYPRGKCVTLYTIPDGTKTIAKTAFAACYNIDRLSLGNTVETICEKAFFGCKTLTEIKIPDSVKSIKGGAFANCTALSSVTLGNGLVSLGDCDTDSYKQEQDRFPIVSDHYNISGTAIPSYPSNYYKCGIFENTAIRSINIPDSVQFISSDAFYYCDYLENITLGDNVKVIEANAFYSTAYYDNPANWVNGMLYIGNNLVDTAPSLSGTVRVLPGTKCIAEEVFYNNDTITSVVLPAGISVVGKNAFAFCDNLQNVEFLGAVDYIGEGAFSCCYALKSVVFNGTTKYIGCDVFWNASEDFSITISDVSSWCNTYFASSLGYDWKMYLNGTEAKNITIPKTVNYIQPYAFYGCSSIEKVTIEEGVKRIGAYAFYDCDNFNYVKLPKTLNALERYSLNDDYYYYDDNVNLVFNGTKSEWLKIEKDYYAPNECDSYLGGDDLKSPKHEEKLVSNGIKITWEKVPAATGYAILKTSSNIVSDGNNLGGTTTDIGAWPNILLASDVTSYLDKDVEPGYAYRYAVITLYEDYYSSYPEYGPALSLVGVPQVDSILSTSKGVKFTWTEVPGVTGYIVYKLVDGGYQQVAVQAPTNRVYVDRKVEDGKTYHYAVATMDNIGNPIKRTDFSFTYKKLTSLATPTVTSANATGGIKVTWNAIENAESYTVYRRVYNESTKKYSGWTTIKTGYTGTSFTDTNVKFGIIYSYTVRAVNGDVRSSYKAATGTRVNVTPTVKVANASSGVKVTWNAVPNATGYTVYSASYNAKTKKWSGWTNRGTVKSGTTSWTDKKTKSGTYYKYTVRACYNSFKSSYKASDKIWYLAQPSVTVKAASNGVNVNWTQSAGAKTYTVYRAEYNAKTKTWSGWKTMGSLSKDKKSWTDKSAKKDVYYKYTVRAVNGNYKSTYKASANVKR